MEHLESFIKDCDRKIQIAKKRLEETQDDHQHVPEVGVFFTVLNYRVKTVCRSFLHSPSLNFHGLYNVCCLDAISLQIYCLIFLHDSKLGKIQSWWLCSLLMPWADFF